MTHKMLLWFGIAATLASIVAMRKLTVQLAGGTGALVPSNSPVERITGVNTPLAAPSLAEYFTQSATHTFGDGAFDLSPESGMRAYQA